MAGITLSSIKKSFADTDVLRSVSLDIADGAFVTLVGPSGCGKSTLLRILAGLETPDEGEVLLDGAAVTSVRPADRNLAMVFQSYALYPHLTVAENMLTPLKLRDLSRRERLPVVGPLLARSKLAGLRRLVQETADVLQITHLLDRKPGQLSGGQRQRVALGRAMVRQPKAFLMDEPLSNLDAALRVHMRAELSQLHKRLTTTFVYVTHDQAEALTMSDRMAVMMGGEILQYGAPDDVYNAPRTLSVAEFIGSPKINILPAEADDMGRVVVDGVATGLSVATPRQPLSVGVRPEHLSLCTADRALISGRLAYTENLGSDVYLHLIAEGRDKPVILRCLPEVKARLTEGEMLHAMAPADKLLVFAADGMRLTPKTRVIEAA